MPQLKYKRQQWSGTYHAKSDTHSFAVDKPGGSTWCLRIWSLPTLDTLSKIVHYSDDHRTMADAKAAAQKFADQQGA